MRFYILPLFCSVSGLFSMLTSLLALSNPNIYSPFNLFRSSLQSLLFPVCFGPLLFAIWNLFTPISICYSIFDYISIKFLYFLLLVRSRVPVSISPMKYPYQSSSNRIGCLVLSHNPFNFVVSFPLSCLPDFGAGLWLVITDCNIMYSFLCWWHLIITLLFSKKSTYL